MDAAALGRVRPRIGLARRALLQQVDAYPPPYSFFIGFSCFTSCHAFLDQAGCCDKIPNAYEMAQHQNGGNRRQHRRPIAALMDGHAHRFLPLILATGKDPLDGNRTGLREGS
jgi:hypothetical protein